MKIQLKRSNQLDGGEAKKPSADQMEYGELAVNYNANDPVIFLKDSNNQIVSININNIGSIDSGSNPPGTGNNVGDLFFDVSNNQLLFWNGSSWVPLNTNLGYTPAPTKGTITNSSGTDADIPLADNVYAGLLSPEQYQKLLDIVGVVIDSPSNGLKLVNGKLSIDIATTSSLGVVKVGSGLAITPDGTLSATAADDFLTSVNLGYIQESDHNLITNDAGTGVRLELANTSLAGLMSPSEHIALYNLTQRSYLEEVNLTYQANGNGPGRIINSGGSNAEIPIVNSAQAGLMSGIDKSNLDILVAGGGGGGGGGLESVSLEYIVTSTGGTMKPTDQFGNLVGSSTDIPLASNIQPGLMDSKDKDRLNNKLTPPNDGRLDFITPDGTIATSFTADQAVNTAVGIPFTSENTTTYLEPILCIPDPPADYEFTTLTTDFTLPETREFKVPIPPKANGFLTYLATRVSVMANPQIGMYNTQQRVQLAVSVFNPYVEYSGRNCTAQGSFNSRIGTTMGGVFPHEVIVNGDGRGNASYRVNHWAPRYDLFTCDQSVGDCTFTFKVHIVEATVSRIEYHGGSRLLIVPFIRP